MRWGSSRGGGKDFLIQEMDTLFYDLRLYSHKGERVVERHGLPFFYNYIVSSFLNVVHPVREMLPIGCPKVNSIFIVPARVGLGQIVVYKKLYLI